MAQIRIPTPLRGFCGQEKTIYASGSSVQEVLKNVGKSYPELLKQLQDNQGRIYPYIRIFVGDKDIRSCKQDIRIQSESVIQIIPAIAGGFM